ncbi:hypothetical protein LAV_00133 [Sphingobium phage Lacusarx]|uniref:Uncharacterized protein n=1 Tax=Sphingobium phage Lacusarx TaxID=1980139 RepID=A0A1W6DX64_9CAUD|nr:hypothetical protein FDH44_gp170 [Sphingobium phage Lacusarx]ARK07508.1 hypothetical protein LAV_00133 [Sphingobium phage Lacusarx]
MAFKLNKAMITRRAEIISDLQDKKDAIIAAIENYNKSLEDARDFIDNTVAGHFNDEFNDKSEKWQEGERGDATREWIDEIEGVSGELVDVDAITDDELQEHIDYLENIPEEPNY